MAVAVVDNIPETWLVGIDLHFFETNAQFKGIKLIPPGFHLIHWGKDITSLRSAYLFLVPNYRGRNNPKFEDNLIILGYQKSHETLVLYDRSDLNFSAIQSRLEGLLPYMLKYPLDEGYGQERKSKWQRLTDRIDFSVLATICPSNCVSTATTSSEENAVLMNSLELAALDRASRTQHTEEGNGAGELPSTKSRDQILAEDPVLSSIKGFGQGNEELRFYGKINLKRTWREDAEGTERTHQARDLSWYLGHLVREHYQGLTHFIAEFQLCFVLMAVLANYAACEQWKRILTVILRSSDLQKENPDFCNEVLELILLQLDTVPSEYIDDLIERSFLQNLMSNAALDGTFGSKLEQFDDALKKHDIVLPDDDDDSEIEPVIID